MKQYWLVKSEPDSYSWDNLVKERLTSWTGVRNFLARKNLRAMKNGDDVLFYHSVTEKAVVGIASVKRTAYPDKTAKDGDWSAVDLAPKKALKRPVTLGDVRAERSLKNMSLLRCARLSVQPVSKAEFDRIVKMGS